jgi:hypothetical protein
MIIIFQVYLFFLAVFLLTICCLTSVISAGRIKRLCETELGVITQCCLARNVQNVRQHNISETWHLKSMLRLVDEIQYWKMLCIGEFLC